MPAGECAEIIGLRRRRMPLGLMRRLASVMWKLRRSETPPGNLHFAIHPWIVSNEKLKRETGWQPRYSSRETFEITMRAHGRLPADGAGASAPAALPEVPRAVA
jgi:UDP-glucose 4-epimerase